MHQHRVIECGNYKSCSPICYGRRSAKHRDGCEEQYFDIEVHCVQMCLTSHPLQMDAIVDAKIQMPNMLKPPVDIYQI